MRVLIYESHSTSEDNEKKIASGHLDPPLSETGKQQATALGNRYLRNPPDIIFCSDLKRSYETAQIAFPHVLRIQTPLLREWDYGIYNGKSVEEVEHLKSLHIQHPFPKGENLKSATARILNFLDEQLEKSPYQRIMIIAHRSAFYALEHRYHRQSLESIVNTPWVWREGWIYNL